MNKKNLGLLLVVAGVAGYLVYRYYYPKFITDESDPRFIGPPKRLAPNAMTGLSAGCGEYGELCPPYSTQSLGCLGCAGLMGDGAIDEVVAGAL